VSEIIIFYVANSMIFEKIEKKNPNFAIFLKKGCVLLPKQPIFSMKFHTIAKLFLNCFTKLNDFFKKNHNQHSKKSKN